MNAIVVGIMAVLLAASAQTEEAARQLKVARNAELVDGDLHAAIKQYSGIVAKYVKTDRGVTAMALVHMAECYQKLGDSESPRLYERVIRDYSDQQEAVAVARGHLGRNESLARGSGMMARRVWAGPNVDLQGTISPDGRYLTYSEGGAGDLVLHEIATGTDRRLTNSKDRVNEYALESAISKDGKQVAYSWSHELRLASLTGDPNPRPLLKNEDVSWIGPYDWSRDDKWIAVQLRRKDRSAQIGLVSVQNGSLRVLKSIDWRGTTKILFSPDGKYLAFDLPAGETPGAKRDVFVLAVDGSTEIPAVSQPSDDLIVGWSPDGTHLLFASDRSGSMGLWALAFLEGRPQGAPALIKSDIGRPRSMGFTRSNAFFYGITPGGNSNIQVASFDFGTGKLLSPPISPIQEFVGSNPDWSPDGKYFSSIRRSNPGSSADSVLVIRNLETRETRELRPALASLVNPRWAPDSRSLAVTGTDLKGRGGVYQIDARTGDVSLLAPRGSGEGLYYPQWAPDGKKLYYAKGTPAVFVERDLLSGEEREVYRKGGCTASPALSPDGRYVACRSDPSARTSTVQLFPVAGGEPRELLRLNQPERVQGLLTWLPNSRGVMIFTSEPEKSEFWRCLLAMVNLAGWAMPSAAFEVVQSECIPMASRLRSCAGKGLRKSGRWKTSYRSQARKSNAAPACSGCGDSSGTGPLHASPGDESAHRGKHRTRAAVFVDRRLSRDGSIACSSCHDPERAFSDGRPIAIGVLGRKGRRNAPALINRGYGRSFFWDGRVATLEEQVLKPIQDSNEMDLAISEASARIGLPAEEISHALASFVRSILSGDSPFDRFINGDHTALSAEQQAGLQLFRGKANCAACHVGPNFTDERLHNTGIAWRDGKFADSGAGQGNFKTPTLREVACTAPYMHDGSIATLEGVIDYYDGGGNRNPSLDPEIRPLHLSSVEKQNLIAFLGCLNGHAAWGAALERGTGTWRSPFARLLQRLIDLYVAPQHLG